MLAFADRETLLWDRDQGLSAAFASVFAEKVPHQLFCIKHRLDNLTRHGRGIRGVYTGMALAPTVEAVAQIRESAQFTGLTNAGRAAINNYTDDVQFLSACVDAGGVTYGRPSSQAAESQNHHLAGARSQDLVSSVLWVMKFEARRYQK